MKQLIRHILREHTREILEQRENWSEDRLRKITSQYDNLTDFLKNEKKASHALRRLGLYDEFTSHMDRQANSYTEDEIEQEARKYTNQAEFAKGSPSHYQAFKRKKLQSKFRDFLPTKIKRWTDEMLQQEASKYTTMVDFLNNSQSAYKTAYDRGILDKITQHIPKTKKWTYEEALEEAKKYKTFAEFAKNSSAFYQSREKGWTEDFKKFLKLGKGEWTKYTKDMVIADVSKSHNRVEFRSKFPDAYRAARENGWYDEVTEPLINIVDDRTRLIYAYEFSDNSVYVGLTVNERRRNFDHLNTIEPQSPVALHILKTGLQPIYKIVLRDLTPKEAQDAEGCTEEKYRSKGWKILNRVKTGSLGACRKFWTKEIAQKEAEKYTTRGDFKKYGTDAYQAAQKYGWLEDLTKNMKYADTVVWDYDKTKEFAKKFKTRSEMKYANQSAYSRARTQGWLDEFFPIKSEIEKEKEEYDRAKIESQKYNNRNDFSKGSPGIYNIARTKGWLDELIPKSEKTYNQSNTEDFINKAEKVHGDKYDYSDVDYKNAYTKITVNCREHGPFPVSPTNHLRGRGCPNVEHRLKKIK